MFDVPGFYVAKRYVKFDDARDLWGPAVTLAWDRTKSFADDAISRLALDGPGSEHMDGGSTLAPASFATSKGRRSRP
jgi:hypothetical protein